MNNDNRPEDDFTPLTPPRPDLSMFDKDEPPKPQGGYFDETAELPLVDYDPEFGQLSREPEDDELGLFDNGVSGFSVSDGDDEWKARPWYSSGGVAVVWGVVILAAILVSAFVGIFIFSGTPSPSTSATSESPAASATPSTADLNMDPSDKPRATGERPVESVAPPSDPTFSWWGDGMSIQALRWKPVIGVNGHDFAWHASNALDYGPPQAIADIRNGLGGGDKYVGGTAVFAYGTAQEVTEGELADLADALGPRRGLILVGVGTIDDSVPWATAVNDRYKALADKRPNTQYVDWQAAINADPSLVSEGFLPTQSGAAKWAGLVNTAVTDLYER